MDRHQHNHNAIPFSEAMQKSGFGAFNYILIFISGIVFTNSMSETTVVSFISPIAECDLHMTNNDQSILSAIGYIGMIASSHLWGFLADTKGRRTVIIPTLLFGFVTSLLSSFSNHLWILILLRFLNGFLVSGSSSLIFTYLGEFHVNRTRSRALMGSAIIFTIGEIILPIISWGVINQSWSLPIPFLKIVYKPWRLFIVVSGMPGLISGLALLLYPESPKFLLSVGKKMEAIEVIKTIHKWNFCRGELQIDGLIAEDDITMRNLNVSSYKSTNCLKTFLWTMWNQTVPLFRGRFIRCTAILYIIHFLTFINYQGMLMWFPYFNEVMTEFMDQNRGNKTYICDAVIAKEAEVLIKDNAMQCIDRLETGTYFYSMIRGLLMFAFLTSLVIIVNKVQKAYIVFIFGIVCGACGLIAIHIRDPIIAIYINIFHLIAACGGIVIIAIVLELYPTHLSAMIVCTSLMVGRVGGVVGAYSIGLLLVDNCEIAFYISGISLILSGFAVFLLPKHINFNNNDVFELNRTPVNT